MDEKPENPYQASDGEGPERGRNLARIILLVMAIPPAALMALGALRLWESIQVGYEEGIKRGIILCGLLSISFIIAALMTRNLWRRGP